MVDSGSAVSIITETLADKILQTTKSAKWTDTKDKRNLKTVSNEPIKVLGHLETTITYNQWKDKAAALTVVEDGHRNIIRRDLWNLQWYNNNLIVVNALITLIPLLVKLKRQSRGNFLI